MSIARANSAAFELGGHKFYRYIGQDSHGSEARIFMVDGAETTRAKFQEALVKALQNSNMWDCVYPAVVDAYLGLK